MVVTVGGWAGGRGQGGEGRSTKGKRGKEEAVALLLEMKARLPDGHPLSARGRKRRKAIKKLPRR